MKSEWTYRPLGELVSFASGGTPSKKRDDYWGGTIPWISAKTLKTENIDTSDLFITEEGLKAGSKIAPKGSILLLTRGSGLFNGIPISRVEKDVAFNQDIKCLDSYGEVENEFIFYPRSDHCHITHQCTLHRLLLPKRMSHLLIRWYLLHTHPFRFFLL